MIQIDEQFYYIDLNEIEKYVFKEVTPTYSIEETKVTGEDGIPIQVSTISADNYDKTIQMRYDMIKSMLDTLYNSGIESQEGSIAYTNTMESNSMGAKLIFNTLLVSNFIKNKAE